MIFGRSKNEAEQFAHHTLPIGAADHVVARIGMHVGVLRISGGASDLLDGAFRYTPELEPVLSYEEVDNTGKLTVCQTTPSGRSSNRGRNEWDIAAGVALVEAACGRATNRLGESFLFHQRNPLVNGVCATNGRVHPDILGLIA